MLKNRKVLFITWDGAEVTYLENLFGPIFLKLKDTYGYEFHIIQFTSAKPGKIAQRAVDFGNKGIYYEGVHVHVKFPMYGMLKAKFWDIRSVYRYVKNHQIQVLMPRSINAFFIAKDLLKKAALKLALDADGFPLDERVDFSGLSPQSWRYRFFRDVEFSGFRAADAILCRSQKAKEVIAARAGSGFDSDKVFVINNGTFSASALSGPKKKTNSRPTVIYSGSLGPQYMLEEMVKTFETILHAYPNALFRILTFKLDEVRNYLSQSFPELSSAIEVTSVPASKVQEELEKADLALSFRSPSFSMHGVAPIKIAEYLSAGLSIIYTPWTGDVEELLGGQPFAYRMDFKDGGDQKLFLDWVKQQIESDFSQDISDFASRQFSLQRTAELYHEAIQYGSEKG